MKLTCAISLAILLMGGCAASPTFELNDTAKQELSKLPGKIGVAVERSSGMWQCIIERGILRSVESLPEPPYEASAIKIGYVSGASGLPPQQGYAYRGPYLVSPDRRLAAASMSGPSSRGPDSVIIVDTQTNRTIAFIKGGDDRYIDGIAWSPGSQWIVVLKHSSRLSSFSRFLVSLTGHGSALITYYLHIISLSGETVIYSKISSEVADSWGWIVWMA